MSRGRTFSTQVARSTPFDNATNSFIATDTQAAIEESRQSAFENDRYPIAASYNGNGNVNRYLEIFPGEDSLTAPLLLPSNTLLVQVTVQASANSNGAIRIYNITTDTTIYDAFFLGTPQQVYTGLSIGGLNALDKIGFLVVSSNVNKPKIRVWLNTQP